MSEPEQCIICLDPLPRPSVPTIAPGLDPDAHLEDLKVPAAITTAAEAVQEEDSYLNNVAALDGCDHIIHDACIRSWAQKTNTCPICRNPFHSVRVYNGVDGTAISTYHVQDKKQVAEFDVQQWLGENPEEEEEPGNPCPICNSAEREDILLLCDSCDAVYHTHCVGLDYIPDGDWYCMECSHLFQLTDGPDPEVPEPADVSEPSQPSPRPQYARRPNPRDTRGYHVRTRARLRRARRQARNVEWQGAWGEFSGRFYDMSELDLDNHDDEDEDLEQYRRFQALRQRELERWQQRMDIAHRLGARDAFANNIPPAISERLQSAPEPIPESRDERRAWGALDRARAAEESTTAPASRKRKARSVTASPREPAVQEPERKLKRPRTRRLPNQVGEASTSVPSPLPTAASTARPPNGANGSSSRSDAAGPNINDPPLVSSLLKELEPNGTSDDEAAATPIEWRFPPEASSPVMSPSPSAYSSPRALSRTPPPIPSAGRLASPAMSLSTNIQPRYPPANYSPTRRGSDHSDSETRPSRIENRSPVARPHRPDNSPSESRAIRTENWLAEHSVETSSNGTNGAESRPLELRQPQPRRPRPIIARREEQSPPRWTMTQEEKKSINEIVKNALRPHWRAQKLTTEQYAAINRDISRKLYDEVKSAASLDEDARRLWEKRATREVAQALAELQA
ncbi:hypothetical protein G7046_g6861 [Stylonectria norvegica]|nr:hypothetical protein G7046_g6861 [Stylonectria norvegica]